jgi:hypothetical protein
MTPKSLPIFIFIAFSIAALTTFANPSGVEYVGYRHKGVTRGEKLPNGAKDLGGGLLSDEDYGVTRFTKGKNYMLWLEKIVERNDEGVPQWEVKDVLVFNKLKKNQEFLFSYSSPCTENGEENLDLIVLAELPSKTKIYKIVKAWRANVKDEKFEQTPIEGIICQQAAN